MDDLLIKKCVLCDKKDLSPMMEETVNRFKLQVPKWELVKGDYGVTKLRRKFKVKTFLQGLELFKIVANLAQYEDHFPDLHIVETLNVTIELCTHACGGLTENDFILAAKIDKLPLQQFLRHMLPSRLIPPDQMTRSQKRWQRRNLMARRMAKDDKI